MIIIITPLINEFLTEETGFGIVKTEGKLCQYHSEFKMSLPFLMLCKFKKKMHVIKDVI